jgi:hypothetical protein
MRGLPAVLAALLLAGTTAHAHPEPFPKRDRLELHRDRITLTIDYVIAAPDEARALADAFDRDRSGALDAEESSRLSAYLADQAAQFARVEVDGAALPWVRLSATPWLSRERLETRLVLEVRWAGAARRVQFSDRHKDRRVTVPVQLVSDGVDVVRGLSPGPYVFAGHPLTLELAAAGGR